jgi:hypothetical protein
MNIGQVIVRVARIGVAGVWLHQGAWAKLGGGDPRHEAIVASVPGLSPRTARLAVGGLGLAETGLALWVLSGRGARWSAATQTALVVGMNAGGLAFAGSAIEHPARLLARNSAFLGAVWTGA